MGCWPFQGNNQFQSSQVRSSFFLMIYRRSSIREIMNSTGLQTWSMAGWLWGCPAAPGPAADQVLLWACVKAWLGDNPWCNQGSLRDDLPFFFFLMTTWLPELLVVNGQLLWNPMNVSYEDSFCFSGKWRWPEAGRVAWGRAQTDDMWPHCWSSQGLRPHLVAKQGSPKSPSGSTAGGGGPFPGVSLGPFVRTRGTKTWGEGGDRQ